MRIALSCLGLIVALGIAGACFTGVVVIAMSMEQAIQVPEIQPAVPDATPAPAPAPVCPGPDCPNNPKPDKPDKPKNPRKPWGEQESQSVGLVSHIEQQRGGLTHDGPVHNGQEVQIDLPTDILKRNIASKGLGCCVFRSINYCGLWQNQPEVIDLPEKMKEAGIEGGGWPEKVDRIMKQFAPNTRYMQVNGDWDMVKLALKTGRCVAITYGSAHMVCLVKLENGVGCYRDNNKVGPTELEWGTEDYIKQHSGGSRMWAVILLNPRPPMPPRSRVAVATRLSVANQTPKRKTGEYRWGNPIEGEEWPLFRNGHQIGSLLVNRDDDYYRELTPGGEWGDKFRRPPIPMPEDAMVRLEEMPPGVEFRALPQRECYSLCGQQITREQAMATLEDDSAKLSLTVIGSKQETARVRADLDRPEFAAFKSHVILQEYTPDNWAVSPQRFGFDVSGHPTVYLETPQGDPLWHENQYDGVSTLEALRKKDPNYKPDSDPGMPRGPSPAGVDEWGPASLLACLGLLGFFLLSLMGGALVCVDHLLDSLFVAEAAV